MRLFKAADGGDVGAIGDRGVAQQEREPFSLSRHVRWGPAVLLAAGLAGAVMTVVAVMVSIDAQPTDQLAALGRGLVVAVPVAVGLYACRRGPYPRFAHLLLATALLSSVMALAESMHSLPYSIGRVSVWLLEPLVIYLVLVFPTGRLRGARERALVAASVATVVLLYLPTALLVTKYPTPVPWSSCTTGCPANAFMVSSSQPSFITEIVDPLRSVLTQVLFLLAVLLIIERMRGASALVRRTQGPVLAAAIVRFLSITAYLLLRKHVMGGGLDAVGWIWLFMLPVMALAFLWGMLRWRLFMADALERMTLTSNAPMTGGGLRASLAALLGDRSLRILYQVGTGWVEETGEPTELPEANSGHAVTEITGSRGQVMAVVHDEALGERRGVVQAAAAHVLVGLENEALQAQVKRSLRELSESRTEVAAAADSERKRIRQNLHDGAQQHLVALLIRLELAGEEIEHDPARGAQLIHELTGEVEETLDEIRVLAHGIDPPLLSGRGLVEALRASAAGAPIPTTLDADGIGRYPREIETCVYFVSMEALQNAHKHARGATAITIRIREAENLEFDVQDDGAGFDRSSVTAGLGMANMQDRLTAIGGRLTIESAPGAGTKLSGTIPLRPRR
jgi:signal transduction histidine kinase